MKPLSIAFTNTSNSSNDQAEALPTQRPGLTRNDGQSTTPPLSPSTNVPTLNSQTSAGGALSLLTKLSFSERLTGFLAEDSYDWEGEYVFDGDKRPVLSQCKVTRINMMMRPMPEIGPKMRAELVEAKDMLAQVVRPGSRGEFAVTLTKLAIHYPQQYRDPSFFKPLLDDYHLDLGYLPIAVLEDACLTYRRSGEKWFPSAKQLHDLAYGQHRKLKRLQYRVDRALGIEAKAAPKESVRGISSLSDVLRRVTDVTNRDLET